jgi:hypothetical protein
MGVSIKLGSTAGDPLASFGIATLKGAGHELISVATSAVVGRDMPDGYPLGLVEKGTLAKATSWGTRRVRRSSPTTSTASRRSARCAT